MSIHAISHTVSQGKTHIAVNRGYIGKIDSYNNWFTKLFAFIFDSYVKVNLGDKTIWANKKDYVKHLHSLGLGFTKDYKGAVSQMTPDDLAHIAGDKKMHQFISTAKKAKLLEKYFNANTPEKQIRYLDKGMDPTAIMYIFNQRLYHDKKTAEEAAYRSINGEGTAQYAEHRPFMFAHSKAVQQVIAHYVPRVLQDPQYSHFYKIGKVYTHTTKETTLRRHEIYMPRIIPFGDFMPPSPSPIGTVYVPEVRTIHHYKRLAPEVKTLQCLPMQ